MSINIITHKGIEYTHNQLIETMKKKGVKLKIRDYQSLFRLRSLPAGTYIFTDRERLDHWQLRACGRLYQALSEYPEYYKLYNNPAQILSKHGMLRQLFRTGINPFDCYTVTERTAPVRYPVFLKTEYEHKRPIGGLLENKSQLHDAIHTLIKNNFPLDGVIITEYFSTPLKADVFRRLSSYVIGQNLSFAGAVHEKNWCVKYGQHSIVGDEEYREERQMIDTNFRSEEIKKVVNLLNIEYGRVDYNVVDGKLAIYEINTNPHIPLYKSTSPNPIRNANNKIIFDNYINYLAQIDYSPNKIFMPKLVVKIKKTLARH